jgi:hypothetical protein
MNTPNDNTAAKGLRGWWLTPPRSGLQRFIYPWEYRHLRVFAALRVTAGCLAAAGGFICLAYSAYGWAALFLVIAALSLAAGAWFLSIASSTSART